MLYLCTTCRYQTVNKKCYFLHLQLHEENSKQEEEEEDKKNINKTSYSKAYMLTLWLSNQQKPLLKAHEKTHSNTYDWKCPQCNYKAYREYNLIHENIRYHCDLCSYTTTRTNYLKVHIKVFHNNPSKS